MPQSRLTLIQDWAALSPYAEKWNSLACAVGSGATIFQTYEWHQCWWQAFGEGNELWVLLAERDGRLVGIAPMMLAREKVMGLSRRVLRFVGSHNFASDYCDFIIDPTYQETAHDLISWFGSHKRDWHRADFFNLPSHSPRRSILEGDFRSGGINFISTQLGEAPTRTLSDTASNTEVLSKKSLRRHFSYFQKNGEISFRHIESREEILNFLDAFFQQHIERRAIANDKSQFLEPQQKEFYRSLVKLLPLEWLRFGVVHFNGAPLGFHFGFEFGKRLIWYKPTFNVEHRRRSPGEVLLRYVFQYAIDTKLEEFDFTNGNENYKYRFSNLVRTNHQILAFSQRWEYLLHTQVAQLRAKLRPLRTLIKPSKPMTKAEAKEPATDG